MTPTETIDNIIKRYPTNDTFKYQLLSRMQQDCNYFLGNGGRHPRHLWAEDVAEHIKCMKALWNSFSGDGKPEWLTMEQIEELEKLMK